MSPTLRSTVSHTHVVTERRLTEREAFRAARRFLEQFNEREKSEAIDLLISWMEEGMWQNPLETADPAQWYDWVDSVDQVLAEPDDPPHGNSEQFAAIARRYINEVDTPGSGLPPLVNTLTRLVAAAQLLKSVEPSTDAPPQRRSRDPEEDRARRHRLRSRLGPEAADLYRLISHPSLDGEHDEDPPVIGSITDDLVEVYNDIEDGLLLFEAGHHTDATWEWRFSFQSHWGIHAASALRVLHNWPA